MFIDGHIHYEDYEDYEDYLMVKFNRLQGASRSTGECKSVRV